MLHKVARSIRNLGAIIVDELRFEFLQHALQQIGKRPSLLDLGCGQKPYRELYAAYTQKSFGLDVPTTQHGMQAIDVQGRGTELPFIDQAFDLVFCTEVMEHVAEPKRMLQEIHRVLKPGGYLILTTPFLVPVHEAPYDFFRYTPYGLQHLLEQASFCIVSRETFAEAFGVLISLVVQLQLKFWSALANLLRFPRLYSLLNPIIFFLVYLPQRVYLTLLRAGRQFKVVERAIRQLSYTTKGYGLLAVKS